MKDAMDDFLERFTPRREPGQDEYAGEDGLLYCAKCHTPRQCKVTVAGREHIFPCICNCQKEELEAAKRWAEEAERLIRIQRLRANGIQERHLLDWTFDQAQDTRYVRMAKNYVGRWRQVKEQNLGLLLWGDVGTGKSFLAACIANALIERGVPVLMTNFSKILNQMGGMYSEERYRYIASFSQFPLLVIDDLGIERGTEYALEQVYGVVDERYKSGLPLLVTTNLTIHEIRNATDVAHARIFSRLLEMCTPVHIAGHDRRTAIGTAKQELVKEVLFE